MTDQTQTAVKQFARLALDYSAFMEDHCAYSAGQFLKESRDFLDRLERTVPELPGGEASADSGPDLGNINWIATNAAEKLGDRNNYPPPEAGHVSDDLARIYRYVKQGALLYKTDPARAALFWKQSFASEWRANLEQARAALSKTG